MTECGVSEVTSHCHPELVSGSRFDPLEGQWTVDGQRCHHSVQRFLVLKRTAVLWARSRTGALRDDKVS